MKSLSGLPSGLFTKGLSSTDLQSFCCKKSFFSLSDVLIMYITCIQDNLTQIPLLYGTPFQKLRLIILLMQYSIFQ